MLQRDDLRLLGEHGKVAGIRPWHIAGPLAVVLVSAALEGASFALLIPLADAVAAGGFGFLEDSRTFMWLGSLLPGALEGSPARDTALVLLCLALVLLARAGKLLLDFARSVFLVWRDELYRARIQQHTLARVMGFGRQYFERRSLGQLDTELGWAVSPVDVLSALETHVRHLAKLLFKLAVMLYISIPLTLTLVVAFSVIYQIMGRAARGIESLAHRGVELDIQLRRRILDLLASVPLVKAVTQEREMTSEYGRLLDEARDLRVRREALERLRWPVEEFFLLAGVLLAHGAFLLLFGGFDSGGLARLAVFLLVVQQSVTEVKSFSDFQNSMANLRPRLMAVARLFQDQDKYQVHSGERTFAGFARSLEVQELSFSYGEGVPALQEVTFTIPVGAFVAVVGESGAGKSTLVDLLSRFYDCPPGSILLDGQDIRDFSLPSLYRRMAIVSQDVWILNRSLRENLVFGLDDPPPDERLQEALETLGMQTFLREHPHPLDVMLGDRGVQLSGGQRQRVALARALLRDPDLLILDEATSALDSPLERAVTQALQARFSGRTVIVIAHRLSTVRDAEVLLVLKEGRLVEQGGWEELLARNGEFARLHEAQFGVPPRGET